MTVLEIYEPEPMTVRKQNIKSATEATSMILKADDIIAAGKMKAPPTPPKRPPETEYEGEEF